MLRTFVADNIERLSSLDFGDLHDDSKPSALGKLGNKLFNIDSEFPNSPRSCSIFSNGDFVANDGDDIDYKDVDIGSQDDKELSEAIDDAVKRSSKYLPASCHQDFRKLIFDYKDIFRIKLGNDPPVDVAPMTIEFDGKEKPVKVTTENLYSPEQLDFLKKKCEELVRAGYIYRNSSSKWACAPLIVPKQGTEKFRLTIDLRPINAQTKKNVWPYASR